MTTRTELPGLAAHSAIGNRPRRNAAGTSNKTDAALADVARRFEALFVEMLLKSARTGLSTDALLGGKHGQTYQAMLDQQWAEQVSRSGSLGIADILVRQLGSAPQPVAAQIPVEGAVRRSASAPTLRPDNSSFVTDNQISSVDPLGNYATQASESASNIEGPHRFVNQLWTSAVEAADKLGVAPRVLIAQAALETGWGRSLPRTEAGASSHNLFGIKAHDGWQGPRATVSTLEFMDGVAIRVKAAFRAYDSYRSSFDDYADLLLTNKRYERALASVSDPVSFVQALQEAGYATDPKYAQKIRTILESSALRGALSQPLATQPAPPIVSPRAAVGTSLARNVERAPKPG